jgi:hypothetical protein
MELTPDEGHGLTVVGDDQHDAAALTPWSFGRLCSLASPAIRRPAISATRQALLISRSWSSRSDRSRGVKRFSRTPD